MDVGVPFFFKACLISPSLCMPPPLSSFFCPTPTPIFGEFCAFLSLLCQLWFWFSVPFFSRDLCLMEDRIKTPTQHNRRMWRILSSRDFSDFQPQSHLLCVWMRLSLLFFSDSDNRLFFRVDFQQDTGVFPVATPVLLVLPGWAHLFRLYRTPSPT